MAIVEGINRKDYKRANRSKVIKLIATGVCESRIDLVKQTGMSKMTISNIVNELLEDGILAEESSIETTEMGRRPIKLVISEKAPKVIGIEIQRKFCTVILCCMDMTILKRERIVYEHPINKDMLVNIVFELTDKIIETSENVVSIGISSIGPISVPNGMILRPNFFFGIENLNIVQRVRERYQLPVYFVQDNQGAVQAELLYGNGKGYNDILLVSSGEGVGCGVTTCGQLQCNSNGLPPEMGHMSIDYNGPTCLCGRRGCLETYIRTPVLMERLRAATGKDATFEEFAAMSYDPNVDQIFSEAVTKLGAAVLNIVNLLNCDIVLLSKDLAGWDNKYVVMLEKLIQRRRFAAWEKNVSVKKTYFGRDAGLMGSACIAIAPIFEGEIIFD